MNKEMSQLDRRVGDPGIFALSLFGLSLIGLGVQLLIGTQASVPFRGASAFAVLIAGMAETAGAFWYLVRRQSYLAGVLGTFGIWLIGLFLLLATGPILGMFTPKGLGLYILLLVGPTLYLTVPPLRQRMAVFTLAFVALLLLEIFFGLSNILASDSLGRAGGASAIVAGLCIWATATEIMMHEVAAEPEESPAENGYLPTAPSPGAVAHGRNEGGNQ